MQINLNETRQYLRESEFEDLFTQTLGWENHTQTLPIVVDETEYILTAIAQKRGMAVYECPQPISQENIPDYATRRKIQKQVAKTSYENLIIYANTDKSIQIWQWVKKEQGKPDACREHRYENWQSGESLIQKLQNIVIPLEEEEGLTLFDVTGRVHASFDVEKVTKKFYDRFKKEHDAFLEFLSGIPDEEMQKWYVSVMLNRLMFIYFIQKKGFLNSDINYLQTKLRETQEKGTDLYYKEFLCPLFFEGFAKPEDERTPEMSRLLGKIPYLNGGIFQKHQLETLHGENIEIPDTAFEQIFNFFEQYDWHLDDRPLRNDNEINPDVLGYIFEKYINQKQMGAYYTKEDITEYISKNTIIPFLFDKAREKCKIAFDGNTFVWKLLQENPDKYIYDAVKKGTDLDLPEDIAIGIDKVSERTKWNERAPDGVDEIALPTEIWREVVARRQRYETVRSKLANGEIKNINDLITYNLNIRQFAQDVIENCEGPELLRAFWKAITKVTVLDPTCGSGAFLFAALNILEPLYEACLNRMQVFVDELKLSDEKPHPKKYSDFHEVLKKINQHPNHKYFVLKSIIIHNLYGVDIMDEAIEICKLRLFLKMVAQIDNVKDIEPLPDIDFNIQAGNTLVGFATYEEVEKAVTERLDSHFDDTMQRIEDKAKDIKKLYDEFRDQQTTHGGVVTPEDKQNLQGRLMELEDELNEYLAFVYAIDKNDQSKYQEWKKSHNPFHWFIAFYGILQDGGFDVIIGNPPYRSINKINYSPVNYNTIECRDLFALCCERSSFLNNKSGSFSMIIPLNGYSTEKMCSLRTLLLKSYSENHLSYFSASDQPASLFTGVRYRLMIFVNRRSCSKVISTTRFLKWFNSEREFLFNAILQSHSIEDLVYLPANSKLSSSLEESVLKKVFEKPTLGKWRHKRGIEDSAIYYHNAPVHWGKVLDFIPFYQVGNERPKKSSHIKSLYFDKDISKVVLCFLNSNLFYWWNWHFTNCRDLTFTDIDRSRVDLSGFSHESIETFRQLSDSLMTDLRKNSKIYKRVVRGVLTQFDSFYPALSKHIIDDIDRELAQHYCFTEEELDFIINYDFKYRMGLKYFTSG